MCCQGNAVFLPFHVFQNEQGGDSWSPALGNIDLVRAVLPTIVPFLHYFMLLC